MSRLACGPGLEGAEERMPTRGGVSWAAGVGRAGRWSGLLRVGKTGLGGEGRPGRAEERRGERAGVLRGTVRLTRGGRLSAGGKRARLRWLSSAMLDWGASVERGGVCWAGSGCRVRAERGEWTGSARVREV